MGVFVIIETADGFSRPVAVRHNNEEALARCTTLAAGARDTVQERDGKVETIDNGARYVPPPGVEFTVHRVDDFVDPT